MSFLKSNYGLGRKASSSTSSHNPNFSVSDLEAELLKHVGGSFVYVKTKKFFVDEV